MSLLRKWFGTRQLITPPHKNGSTAIEMLEQRSLMSVSPTFTATTVASAGNTASAVEVLALRASVISLRLSSATSSFGEFVTLRAGVAGRTSTGVPTGTVTFKTGSATLGTAAVQNGVAHLTLALPFGASSITAEYSGSSKFAVSTSAARPHIVTQVTTTNKLSLSVTSAVVGEPVALQARIASVVEGAGVPTGKVAFYDGGTFLGTGRINSVGRARMTVATLFPGTHPIKALYFGDTQFAPHRSSIRDLAISMPALTTSVSGLQTATVVPGTGAGAVNGNFLTVHYTGFLGNGTRFESSLDRGQPFDFDLGFGEVIQGWDEGFVGAKAGETRVLVIPPKLAYGAQGQGNIPPNSTLLFIVQILSVS